MMFPVVTMKYPLCVHQYCSLYNPQLLLSLMTIRLPCRTGLDNYSCHWQFNQMRQAAWVLLCFCLHVFWHNGMYICLWLAVLHYICVRCMFVCPCWKYLGVLADTELQLWAFIIHLISKFCVLNPLIGVLCIYIFSILKYYFTPSKSPSPTDHICHLSVPSHTTHTSVCWKSTLHMEQTSVVIAPL